VVNCTDADFMSTG